MMVWRAGGSACGVEVLDVRGQVLRTLAITGIGFEYMVLALDFVLEAHAA